MKKQLLKLSLFSKALLVLIFTIVITAVLAFIYMYGEMRNVVTHQIQQGASDALNIANIQLQERIVSGISLLIDLRTDKQLQQALAERPQTAAQRAAVSEQIRSTVRNAYYAVNTRYRVAIVSAYGDVYANWEMVNTGAVLALCGMYQTEMQDASYVKRSTLFTQMVHEVEITTTGGGIGSYYMQYMPLVGKAGQPQGVAMILMPETELYSRLQFSEKDNHSVFLLDADGIILSAFDKTALGMPFQSFLEENKVVQGRVLYAKPAPRTQLILADIMSEQYIEQQVWQIMRRMLVYTLLSISGIIVAAYILMHSITRPLKQLTKRMISGDYTSFLRESESLAGKNEILLLEHGFALMDEDIRNLLRSNKAIEEEKRTTELAALQSQIQPHFLFNTLNTVRCAILNKHSEKAANLIVKLISLLRMTLVNGDELISLEKEVQAVGYYLDIIKMRHTVQFTFCTEISNDTADMRVPKLLLQPLVENCVIHGFAQMKEGGQIMIRSQREGDVWVITVKNNGTPLAHELDLQSAASTQDSFSGIGVQNVNRRVKLYYSEAAGLRIYTDSDGFTVNELRMPLPCTAGENL